MFFASAGPTSEYHSPWLFVGKKSHDSVNYHKPTVCTHIELEQQCACRTTSWSIKYWLSYWNLYINCNCVTLNAFIHLRLPLIFVFHMICIPCHDHCVHEIVLSKESTSIGSNTAVMCSYIRLLEALEKAFTGILYMVLPTGSVWKNQESNHDPHHVLSLL